jgi:hypothetical protein
VLVGVAVAATEVTPAGPALATGWKKTTRSKVGLLAPQPWEEPPDAGADALLDICESLIVTRVTPLISRSCDMNLATSSCERVHPLISKAGAVIELRTVPVPLDPEPPEFAPGTTVPMID